MKKLLLLAHVFIAPILLLAQVTTGTISGSVKADTSLLQGATITATHLPTGTVFRAATSNKGVYNLVNLIPGGPYSVEVSHVGYQAFRQDSLWVLLGENTPLDASLTATGTTLREVTVTGGAAARRKTGASTSISRQQIDALPTLSRSLQDFTRLTPQANGNSFGGMSNRFNNITVDGSVNNDVFGLAASGTPGGQASTTPISLDAIQEIQVVLAPYDITYGNFTGGGVNAVTRSGTNKLQGSAYYLFRNQGTVGSDPVTRIKTADFSDKTFGARLGGPIIKNKLFFFANVEFSRRTAPTTFNAGDSGALLSAAEAQMLADTMRLKYGYDAGASSAFNAKTESNKYFGRLDWNISDKHRLTIRHNYIKAFDDNISRSTTLFRFGNNTYRFNNKQNISVAELRSRFSNKVSNDLLLGLQSIRDFRSTYGSLFPSIEITQNSGTIQLGTERSSAANELDQDIFEVTDNVRIFKGKHTFTIGTHNEFFKFRNLFINNFNGRWRFGSLSNFYNNQPRQFDVSYSATDEEKPAARFDASQLGFYAQDEMQVTSRLRITGGLRMDVPIIGTTPAFNKIVDSTYAGKYSTSNIPNKQLLWSPRVGFNWDITGSRRVIIRGGAGIFTGRVPFVWISNQFANTGLLLRTTSQTDNTPTQAPFTVNHGQGFVPDVNAQDTIGSAGNTFEADLIDRKFKLPQVARFNLATDLRLPGNINATFEFMYSKTLNNVLYQDVNLADPVPGGVPDSAYNNGADRRLVYPTARRRNPNITNAILITNTNKGYSYNLTAQFSRTWKHVNAMFGYNYNRAKDVNSGANSTALSNWEFVQVVGDPNNPPLATSSYELRHRIIGAVSLNFDYARHMRTILSFFYSANSGQPFTYVVNGDINNDGRFGNDLVYVPRDQSEINFVDFLNSDGSVRFTAAQQATAFQDFINNDKYLSGRRGQYAERNGRSTPWEHVIDMRLAQQFYVNTGGRKHTLELTFDVFNLTNLLNRDWGRQYFVTNQAYNLLTTVSRGSGASAVKGYNFTVGQDPWTMSFGSRFQGQIGVRYTFD